MEILAEDPEVAIRYRYYEEAPATVTLPAGELMSRLPDDLTHGVEPADRAVEIPCGDLLTGSIPRIALGRLQELLPDLVRIPEGRDPGEKIILPPGWIALHFQMVTRREELPPEEVPAPEKPATEEKPTARVNEVPEKKEAEPETNEAVPGEKKPVVEAVPAKPVTTPVAEPANPKEVPPAPVSDTEAAPKPRKGFFDSLPIFRRRAVVETPLVEVIQAVPESQKNAVKAGSRPETQTETADKNDAPVVTKERKEAAPLIPVATKESGTSLALEPLWKLDPQDQLADPTALQALFMTEELLTLERVISKAGELPGLKACVLAHGNKVLCTSNTASGIDLKTLSGQAMTMLGQIRESSAGMGLGAVPAVTLHAEQGALSFLHKGELCLLVLHADRGFVPGVRERLQEMLGHLMDARPALPGGGPVAEGRFSKDESR